jgi:CheY-like chemotaxis protein/anti-sigma regulatory factor (Ser/Thr protein kinase)
MPEHCRQHLETSRVSALDAAQIVQRIQTFARPKQETLNFECLDFNALVSDAVELTRPKWESAQPSQHRTIELALHTDAKMAIQGTPTELREVLTNLIFNAVDAMPHGGKITLRTWSTPSDVFVSIRDTGTGMSEFVQHRLFEPLFTTKGEHGNGLGLSISFAIVRRHGGDITVQSALGQGSTFTVRLPAVEANSSARREVEAAATAPDATKGLRILVIEDEARIRDFLDTALTALGYRPSFAVDGEAGLALFAAEPFAIVLTDVGLPGISGEEVARVIAQRVPRTPVVLLTGWADQIAGRYGLSDGLTRVLGKPVKLGTLAATLADIVAGTIAC